MSSSDFDPGGYLVWVVGSLYLVLVDGPYGSIVHMVFHNHPCGFVGNLAFRMVPFVGSIGHDCSSVGNLVWAGSIVGNDFAHMVPDKGSYGSIVVHMVLVDKGPCGIYSMVCIVCLGNCSCFCISA